MLFHRGKVGVKAANVGEVDSERDRSINGGRVKGGTITTTGCVHPHTIGGVNCNPGYSSHPMMPGTVSHFRDFIIHGLLGKGLKKDEK